MSVFRLGRRAALSFLPLLLWLGAQGAQAHIEGISQNRLEAFELSATQYRIAWRSRAYELSVSLPQDCAQHGADLWQCAEPLAGRSLTVNNLGFHQTDAVVRVQRLDGSVQAGLVTPAKPQIFIAAGPATTSAVVASYLLLGVEHIVLGIDHLLFVLGLLLILKRWRQLVAAITAFTVAHSLTLGLSALNIIALPIAPTEAVIALSILVLAVEYTLVRRARPTFTSRYPAAMAFAVGLIHGLGFASVLADIGLPTQSLLVALLSFNLGVELGQLAFLGLVAGALHRLRRRAPNWLPKVELALAYLLGSAAAYWLVERMVAMVSQA